MEYTKEHIPAAPARNTNTAAADEAILSNKSYISG